MKNGTKNILVALLVATLLAPGFYFGIAPAPTVEAQTEGLGMEDYMGSILSAGIAVSACIFGSVINGLLRTAISGITRFLTNLATQFFGSIFSNFLTIFTGKFPILRTVPVYVSDTNYQLQGAADAAMSMEFKECVLDGIVWVAKRILIDTITAEVMNWIETGFLATVTDGYPTFIQNPGDWASDLAFSTTDLFLEEGGLLRESVCEPFADANDIHVSIVDIAADIANKPTFGPDGRATCDMEAIGGVDGFESMVEEGALTDRGILAAMALGEEGNNMFSAIFNLQAETHARVNKVVASEMTLGEWGDGYHSMRCGEDVDQVCTPGQFIAKQIDDWMGGALGQLEVADEVSEIVDALFAHLTEEIFFDYDDGLLRTAPAVNDYGLSTGTATPYEGETTTDSGVSISFTDENGVVWTLSDDGNYISSEGQIFSPDGINIGDPDPGDTYTPNSYAPGSTITVSRNGWVSINGNWHPKYAFSGLGPDYGDSFTFTFSNGESYTVNNSSRMQMYGGDDDVKYQPGGPFSGYNPDIPTMEIYWRGIGSSPTLNSSVPSSVTVYVN